MHDFAGKFTYAARGSKVHTAYQSVSYIFIIHHACAFGARMCELLGGVVAHPSSYKGPLSLPEIRSRLWNPANSHYGIPVPSHALPACQGGSPPRTSYLHCVILSAFTQTEDRSRRRLTAASLIWVNKAEGRVRVRRIRCPAQPGRGIKSKRNHTTAQSLWH